MSKTTTEPGKRRRRDVHGILLLDKPLGMSSNAALQRVKYLLSARKAGHTGSLDPLASGMLPLCFGDATRFSHALLDADKHYRVTARLGASSSTGDGEGEKTSVEFVPDWDAARWQTLADRFIGPIEQVPPMYSALKHDGKRLYQLARDGVSVERPPRSVTIHRLQVEAVHDDALTLAVSCSKGTYIRTLVEDLAEAAGTRAWTAQLRRTGVDPFESPMWTLDAIESALAAERGIDDLMLPPDAALSGWPEVVLSAADALAFCQGRSLQISSPGGEQPVRCYAPGRLFLGTGSSTDGQVLKPARVMSAAQRRLLAER